MADILKGFAGGSLAFLLAWVFPSAVLVGLVTVFVLPIWSRMGVKPFGNGWDTTTILLAVAFTGVFLGVLGSTASTPLYRLVEGYAWPDNVQKWAIGRRRRERQTLRSRYDESDERSGLAMNLLYEKLARYPVADADLAPTRLGNAIHVMELYGRDHFGLDSQTWWTELYSVTPDPIRQQVDNARAAVDFFVAAFYATIVFAVVALGTFVAVVFLSSDRPWGLLAFGIVATFIPWLWYRTAIWGCGYWQSAVQAMVHLGRVPLARSLALELPDNLERERDLWQAATDFVNAPFDEERARALDAYRCKPAAT